MKRKKNPVLLFILMIALLMADLPATCLAADEAAVSLLDGETSQDEETSQGEETTQDEEASQDEEAVLKTGASSVNTGKRFAASALLEADSDGEYIEENNADISGDAEERNEENLLLDNESASESEDYPDQAENPDLDPQWWDETQEETILLSNFGSGYTHDARFANYTVRNGIDVSKYQGEIDWQKVKADGIEFAFIRVGYRGYGSAGTLNADTYYKDNIVNAAKAGIEVGVYIFSQATTEAEAAEEANYAVSLIKGLPVTLPVVMDFEYASSSGGTTGRLYNAGLSKDAATNVCKAFVRTVQSAGYEPMVYANRNMLTSSLNAEELEKSCKIWLAQYSSQATYTGAYTVWQYTSSGTVDGISGRVDMNFWYKKPAGYKIKYVLGGGKQSSKNPKTYAATHGEISLYAPSKKGYTFVGWIWAEDAGTENPAYVTSIPADASGTLTLQAVWRENTYTVYYHSGSSVYAADAEQVVSANYSYTENINLFTATLELSVSADASEEIGIVAFTTKQKGGKKYKVSKLCSKLSSTDGGEVHLYASYGTVNYGLTFDLYGDYAQADSADTVTNSNPVSYTYSVKKSLKLKTVKRTGYTFAGWEVVSGNAAGFDAQKQKLLPGVSGNLILKALWTPVPYRVELKLNTKNSDISWMNGTKSWILAMDYASQEAVSVSGNLLNSSGKTLVGFNTKSNGKGVTVPLDENGAILLSGLSKRKNAKVILYAVWE